MLDESKFGGIMRIVKFLSKLTICSLLLIPLAVIYAEEEADGGLIEEKIGRAHV